MCLYTLSLLLRHTHGSSSILFHLLFHPSAPPLLPHSLSPSPTNNQINTPSIRGGVRKLKLKERNQSREEVGEQEEEVRGESVYRIISPLYSISHTSVSVQVFPEAWAQVFRSLASVAGKATIVSTWRAPLCCCSKLNVTPLELLFSSHHFCFCR